MLWVSSAAAYYIWFFNVVIGYGIVQATFGTEFSLAAESVGFLFFAFLFLVAGIPTLCFVRRPILSTNPWQKRYLLRGFFIVVAVIGLKSTDAHYHTFRTPLADGRMTANPFGVAAHSYLPSNWIAATAMALSNNVINWKLGKNLTNPDDRFHFSETSELDGVFLVFVIGESARFDRMSLLGAERQTNPLLEKEKNLIAYKGTSCNTITKLSLDCMFVREGGIEEKGVPVQQFVHEQNLFNVLKQKGFTVDLFAMQAETRFYNKVGADSYKIREEICAEASRNGDTGIDDFLLVDQAVQSIEQHPNGRHVVILHTKGSHFLYTNRYPRQFAQFRPECPSIDANCTKEELYNSYDNTLLYTDYLLASLIESLRDKKTLLIYTSDHGESIEHNLHFHGTPKQEAPKEQTNVPFIVWASDPLRELPVFAQYMENAMQKQAVNTVVRHAEIFESVLGCLGFKSESGGIRKQNNWCASF